MMAGMAGRPDSAHGLAMARRRMSATAWTPGTGRFSGSPLSWRFVMPALLVGSVLRVLIGGFGFPRASRAAQRVGKTDAPGRRGRDQ